VRKEVQIGPCRLILGDSRDVLPDLKGMADLLVSDPPYKLTSGGRKGDHMKGKFSSDRYDNSGKLMRLLRWDEMAGPMFDACKDRADAYIMANDKEVFNAHAAFTAAGFRLHNLLTWRKETATRNRWYMKDTEYTVYLFKGKARTINFPGSKQSAFHSRPDIDWHPTAKPVELFMEYILNSSQPGDLVLDPFCGSGTTAIAAMRTGRRAVTIEKDPVWFSRKIERVTEEWRRIETGDLDVTRTLVTNRSMHGKNRDEIRAARRSCSTARIEDPPARRV